MGLFDSNEDMIDSTRTAQKEMEAEIKTATAERLCTLYNDSMALESLYGSWLTSMDPKDEYYKIVKGVYESQKSITSQIESRADQDKITLLS